jgi:hypothetical protein
MGGIIFPKRAWQALKWSQALPLVLVGIGDSGCYNKFQILLDLMGAAFSSPWIPVESLVGRLPCGDSGILVVSIKLSAHGKGLGVLCGALCGDGQNVWRAWRSGPSWKCTSPFHLQPLAKEVTRSHLTAQEPPGKALLLGSQEEIQ